MKTDIEGFLYPYIDLNQCIGCNQCYEVCEKLSLKKTHSEQKSYMAYHLENEIRYNSSSGGVFFGLAQKTIRQGGCVFGAAFEADYSVCQKKVMDEAGLKQLAGSKYLQSDTRDTFIEVKEALKQEKQVLYSGTPCQIAGLKSFLGREYRNLVCVSLICHGVPSPLIWAEYLEYQKKEHGEKKIQQVIFRNKKNKNGSWKNLLLTIDFENNRYEASAEQDLYYRGFLENLYLRPSCYFCRAKGKEQLADIIIGDYWGIEYLFPEVAAEPGISAVIVNTEKGQRLFDHLQDDFFIKECSVDDVLYGNPALINSPTINQKIREKFFSAYWNSADIVQSITAGLKMIEEKKRYKRNLSDNKKLVVWGTGNCYKRQILKVKEIAQPYYAVDSDPLKWNREVGYGTNCISPQELLEIKDYFVVIMVDDPKIAFQIAGDLCGLGIYDFDWIYNWFEYASEVKWG